MASNTTIALIGATGRAGTAIAKRLAATGRSILLISDERFPLDQLVSFLQAAYPAAQLETVDCLKDACWEADIIVLAVPVDQEYEIASKFKEVATQKIVVRVGEPMQGNARDEKELFRLLPDSIIVTVAFEPDSFANISVEGKDAGAIELVKDILGVAVEA